MGNLIAFSANYYTFKNSMVHEDFYGKLDGQAIIDCLWDICPVCVRRPILQVLFTGPGTGTAAFSVGKPSDRGSEFEPRKTGAWISA